MDQPPLPHDAPVVVVATLAAGAPPPHLPAWSCRDVRERQPLLIELLRSGAAPAAIVALCVQSSSASGLEG